MADNKSLYAGDFNTKGYKLTCILDEGNITVSEVMNPAGAPITGWSFASKCETGDLVKLEVSDSALYDDCMGNPVVSKISADGTVFGRIISDITWVAGLRPYDSYTKTLGDKLSDKMYRVATVEVFGGIQKITKGILTATDTTKIVPGDSAKLTVDLDNQKAGGFYVKDVASGGTGMVALHAVPKSYGDTTNLMIGITGFPSADKA